MPDALFEGLQDRVVQGRIAKQFGEALLLLVAAWKMDRVELPGAIRSEGCIKAPGVEPCFDKGASGWSVGGVEARHDEGEGVAAGAGAGVRRAVDDGDVASTLEEGVSCAGAGDACADDGDVLWRRGGRRA